VEYSAPSSQPVTSDSIQVTLYTTPASITATTDSVCKNEQAILSVQPQAGITYSWYTTASGGSPVATGLAFTTPAIQQTSTYYVEVMNSYGCVRSNRFPVEATMYPQPNAAFVAAPPVTTVTGYDVSFLSDFKQGYTYFWNFDDPSSSNNTSSIFNPVHTYTLEGNYNVTLIVTSPQGCADTVSRTVAVVLPDNIFIPTGFTPNNDGSNDLFRVRGNNILHYDMSIFNQWGKRIFHSPTEANGWNGEANGQPVPNGTYAYAIEVYFENGTKTFYRGNISVIR
jgi:gliding motility-associated-like protein